MIHKQKVTASDDLKVLWELFERTGSIEAYLLFHEAKRHGAQFVKAKRDVDAMKKELERR